MFRVCLCSTGVVLGMDLLVRLADHALREAPFDFACYFTSTNVHPPHVSQNGWSKELMARANPSMYVLITSCGENKSPQRLRTSFIALEDWFLSSSGLSLVSRRFYNASLIASPMCVVCSQALHGFKPAHDSSVHRRRHANHCVILT